MKLIKQMKRADKVIDNQLSGIGISLDADSNRYEVTIRMGSHIVSMSPEEAGELIDRLSGNIETAANLNSDRN